MPLWCSSEVLHRLWLSKHIRIKRLDRRALIIMWFAKCQSREIVSLGLFSFSNWKKNNIRRNIQLTWMRKTHHSTQNKLYKRNINKYTNQSLWFDDKPEDFFAVLVEFVFVFLFWFFLVPIIDFHLLERRNVSVF